MTVDRTHVLATPGMDAHGSYVALSRHRDGVELHYGRDDFANHSRLVRTLSRERTKDMASDYSQADPARAFAERRGITFRERVAEIVRVGAEKARGIFDTFKPKIPAPRGQDMFADFRPKRQEPVKPELARAGGQRGAVERYARALDEIARMRDSGSAAMPHQREALERAREALDAIPPRACLNRSACGLPAQPGACP
jgi:hypothetical protein